MTTDAVLSHTPLGDVSPRSEEEVLRLSTGDRDDADDAVEDGTDTDTTGRGVAIVTPEKGRAAGVVETLAVG